MKSEFQVAGDRLQVSRRNRAVDETSNLQPSTFNLRAAFTLIELLVVIAILGILAGLAVPALKNLGKSQANVSAARQLLDDVDRARQLAMANRTTVYMVFVPTNFWNPTWMNTAGIYTTTWNTKMTPAAQSAATNLCDQQLAGYTFVANGAVGDQPGRHQWHYLAPWQTLQEGTFIALQKFYQPQWPNPPFTISDPITGKTYPIYGFNTNGTIPFPTVTNTVAATGNNLPWLPYIAFNYLGQLTFDGVNPATRDEYIPLAHGTVADTADANKLLQFAPPTVRETPSGNSTNLAYNIVHVDALTGRAVLEFHKIQ